MKAKTTKRALLMSVISLLLCIAMLIGTTYAWFTDSVTTGVNKIQAGTLDVQLLMKTDAAGEYENIGDSKAPIFGVGSIAQNNNAETLWEPGKTQVAYLAIKNNGNLALKYTVALNTEDVAKELYKVMEYDILEDKKFGEVTAWSGTGEIAKLGTYAVAEDVALGVGDTHYFALAIHMQETAGNEYMGGQVNFDLSVFATQNTVEADSFSTEYDADAQNPAFVHTADEMEDAVAAGGKVYVQDDIALTTDVTYIKKATTLDLGSNMVTANREDTSIAGGYSISALSVVGTDVTINATEEGGVANPAFGYAITLNDGSLTINGGNYSAGGSQAIYVYSGTLTITDGFYDRACYDYGPQYLINCLDSAYKDGTAKVIIKGGTFVNWDPANNASEGAGTNYLAKGYKSVAVAKGEDTLYVVVPESTVVAGTETALQSALTAGGAVALTSDLELGVNSDTMMLSGSTLDGMGNTVDAYDFMVTGDSDCVITTTNGGTVKNLTVIGDDGYTRAIGAGSSGTYTLTEDLYIDNVVIDSVLYAINGSGTADSKVVVTNSEIYGWLSFSGIAGYDFTNCILGTGDSYLGYIVIYGDTSFTNCTFEDFWMCFNDTYGKHGSNVVFTNCIYEGEKVTAENFKTLFMSPGDETDFNKLAKCNVIVDGVTVTW